MSHLRLGNATVITGANGFLGFHVRALLSSRGLEFRTLALGDGFDEMEAKEALDGASTLIHLAGVNRGTSAEVREGNVRLAEQMRRVLVQHGGGVRQVVFANSTQSLDESLYGTAKREAADVLSSGATEVGAAFVDVMLPNLFGEYGRPNYNSVVATFCHLVARGKMPSVHEDRTLNLLHAQSAAQILVGDFSSSDIASMQIPKTVSEVLSEIQVIADLYRVGEIPPIDSSFSLDLFNTYRSYVPFEERRMPLTKHSDERGSFYEVVRAHGGKGQTSFSTTMPGVVRGQHFHLKKIERFVVVSGSAEIQMRPLFGDKVHRFMVDGDCPVALDMPTMWPHSITNVGDKPLHTMFWTNDIYDPAKPDTFAEAV